MRLSAEERIADKDRLIRNLMRDKSGLKATVEVRERKLNAERARTEEAERQLAGVRAELDVIAESRLIALRDLDAARKKADALVVACYKVRILLDGAGHGSEKEALFIEQVDRVIREALAAHDAARKATTATASLDERLRNLIDYWRGGEKLGIFTPATVEMRRCADVLEGVLTGRLAAPTGFGAALDEVADAARKEESK